jgi:hypothetical protein
MNKPMLAAALILGFGAGTAHAAPSCPAFAAPAISFEALTIPVERDLSKSAHELSGSADKWGYQVYSPGLVSSLDSGAQVAKLPDGSACGAASKAVFKIGFKRKIEVASEAAGNACVADAFASQADASIKAEDDALAAFGATIPSLVESDVAAIGTIQAADQQAVQAEVSKRIAVIFKTKILPAFTQRIADADKSVDFSKWKPAECDGDTKKIVAKMSAPADSKNAQPAAKAPQSTGSGYGGGGGRY